MAIWMQPMQAHNLTQAQDSGQSGSYTRLIQSRISLASKLRHMRQKSMVHLRGLHAGSLNARLCFVFSDISFFFPNSRVYY